MPPHFDADAYQRAARSTAVYPDLGRNVVYPALGLSGEAGELLEKVLAWASDEELLAEAGDVLWYASQCAAELSLPFSRIIPPIPEEDPAGLSDAGTALIDAATQRPENFVLLLASGLCVATAKVSETVKKVLRDRGGEVDEQMRDRAAGHLTTALAALEALAFAHGTCLAAVAAVNLEKLSRRAAASTLHGDGDDR